MPDPNAEPPRYHHERHRWTCRTCNAAISTDNPIDELIDIWLARHEGHDLTEEHDGEPSDDSRLPVAPDRARDPGPDGSDDRGGPLP